MILHKKSASVYRRGFFVFSGQRQLLRSSGLRPSDWLKGYRLVLI